jgi:hypothetical protein
MRAVAIGAVVMLAYGTAEAIHFRQFCAKHLAWIRVEQNPSAVVLDGGFAVAREGDALFTCVIDHCFGVAGCHADLSCYCAPATMTSTGLAELLNARSCAVDHLVPSPGDDTGACRHAHCDEHVGP